MASTPRSARSTSTSALRVRMLPLVAVFASLHVQTASAGTFAAGFKSVVAGGDDTTVSIVPFDSVCCDNSTFDVPHLLFPRRRSTEPKNDTLFLHIAIPVGPRQLFSRRWWFRQRGKSNLYPCVRRFQEHCRWQQGGRRWRLPQHGSWLRQCCQWWYPQRCYWICFNGGWRTSEYRNCRLSHYRRWRTQRGDGSGQRGRR